MKINICLPLLHSPGWKGSRVGCGFLHRAVLSVSLSISNRMRPGRSLLAESECISGKMLRSGSETLELASLNIPISVLTEYGRSYILLLETFPTCEGTRKGICDYFGGGGSCDAEVAVPGGVCAGRMRGRGHVGPVPWLWYWSRSR